MQRWVLKVGNTSRSDVDAVRARLRHSTLHSRLSWFKIVKAVVQLLGRVAAARSCWRCAMCDAALACVLPHTYTQPCAVCSPHRLPAKPVGLMAAQLTRAHWWLLKCFILFFFTTFYHLKAPKSLHSEKSDAAFPPVQKGCGRRKVHDTFLQPSSLV